MLLKLKDSTFAVIVKTLVDTKQFEVLDDLIKSKVIIEKPAVKKTDDVKKVDDTKAAKPAPAPDVATKKLLPIEMAREFKKNNKDATSADLKKYLLEQGVKPDTAKSTAYKIIK